MRKAMSADAVRAKPQPTDAAVNAATWARKNTRMPARAANPAQSGMATRLATA